ncbi:MAG: hypothetical protein Q8O93_02590 [bacterium]|nr:hypothetical protein [bacterium]
MKKENEKNKITFMVNDESYSTEEKQLTARQILEIAGIDPANYYLVQIKGNQQISYKDTPDEEIKMHNNLKFIANYTGQTTVT